MSNKDTMTVINNRTGEQFEFPIIDGNIGPSAIDIRSFYAKTGYFTYDPGFTSTASCDSTITYIDGDAGILRHRGYSIEDLSQNCSFLEVVHLLLKDKLPNQQELDVFTHTITNHTMLHEQLMNFYRGFRRDAHPMAIVNGVVGALSSFYHDTTDVNDAQHREIASNRMIAKIPTIVANAYKYAMGQPFLYPSNNLGYVHNFMKMTFGVPCEEYEVSPAVVEAMSKIFILHADHEQNASTSTVRLAGSSGANPYACIAAGVASLWGPAHGGANEAVLQMLGEVGSVKNIDQYIAKAKDKNDPFRLMGFGHRVYKNFDPRANVLKSSCHEVLQQLNIDDPLLELAMRLEETALKDDYFIERKLFPNVDFYSGIILKAIGFPTSMFTALFALARTSGWIAQWGEMLADDRQKIGRPRQIFEGEAERKFVPINQR